MKQQTRWVQYSQLIDTEAVELDEDNGTLNGLADPHDLLISRARLLLALFAVIVLILVLRLLQWQVVNSADTPVSPPEIVAHATARGRIADRNGLLLATDTFVLEVYSSPGQFDSAKDAALLSSMANIIGQPVESWRPDCRRKRQPLPWPKM